MADQVTSQIIVNGNRNIVASFNDLSDGTGLNNYVLIDATSTGSYGIVVGGQTFYPGVHLTVRKIQYDVQGMAVQLLWDATSPQVFATLSGFDGKMYDYLGGLTCPSIAGATGKILATTINPQPDSTFFITLHCNKGIPAS